jgi:hypothetical protein
MNMDSFVSETEDNNEKMLSKMMNELIFSTSPDVFKDFYSIIDQDEDEDENDENVHRLKYKIVLKDIIIQHLEKQIKKYEYGYNMWSALVNSI